MAAVRMNKDCPDGYEHQMSDGSYMCGRVHGANQQNEGGMLQGPTHEHGGIAAVIGGTTPIELEGGEYILNAQTVTAVGQEFLDELNSTSTTYHEGGYDPGELPSPSQYARGGRVPKKTYRPKTKPVPTKRTGGTVGRQSVKAGQKAIPKKQTGGSANCPPGQTYINGGCVQMGSSSQGYQKGGMVKQKFQTGGKVMNTTSPSVLSGKVSFKDLTEGSMNNVSNALDVVVKKTNGGPSGKDFHSHQVVLHNNGNGWTNKTEIGGGKHHHKIKGGIIELAFDGNGNLHGHNL